MVDLIEQCRMACDELIDVTGRAAIEAVLQLVGQPGGRRPRQQGKRRLGDVVFYGRQPGQVMLGDRKLEVERPRLRTRGRARPGGRNPRLHRHAERRSNGRADAGDC